MSATQNDQATTNAGAVAWRAGPFVPLLLSLAVSAWSGFQTLQLWNERGTLAAAIVVHDRNVAEAKKIRTALDTLARETNALADRGNVNARLVVNELKRRGVTIDPGVPPVK